MRHGQREEGAKTHRGDGVVAAGVTEAGQGIVFGEDGESRGWDFIAAGVDGADCAGRAIGGDLPQRRELRS